MTGALEPLAGVAAGILSTLAIVPYTIGVLRGRTRPQRASWVIWTLVGAIAAWSYYESGARQTMWLALSFATNPLVVLALSIRYGTGGWSKLDQRCLLGAACSLAVWRLTRSPMLGLLAILVVDALGALPTVKKVWRRPETEDPTAWILTSVAAAVNLLALERWTFSLAVQPVYSAVATTAITLLVCRAWRPAAPTPAA